MARTIGNMPNGGARELSDLTSWRTASQTLSSSIALGRRLYDFHSIQVANKERAGETNFGRFTAGLTSVQGTLGGKTGRDLDGLITTALKGIQAHGGKDIDEGKLTRIIESLQKGVEGIAGGASGMEKNILHGLQLTLEKAMRQAAKGGFASMRSSSKDLQKGSFAFEDNSRIEDARKLLERDIKKTAATISNPAVKTALGNIIAEMNHAASAAKSLSEKQSAVEAAVSKISSVGSRAAGADRTAIEALSKDATRNTSELKRSLAEKAQNRRTLEINNDLAQLSHALGTTTRTLIALKRSFDAGNALFQQINSKVNQFAQMQMMVSGERGGIGRKLRGAGIDYGHMMGALAAGRSAGIDDRTVINQMVDLQTQLAQARWGEGDLINKAGRWGISTYDASGNVKEANQLMIDFSRKLNSFGTKMEKLQFLHDINLRPEDMKYVANYERFAKRQEYLNKHPEMRGVLDTASYLDESGFSDRADAATKIELRRRQVLNENAIEEGVIPALKRSLHPENWLFNDWTARQKGVQQAKGEDAMAKLTKAINEQIAQGKSKGAKAVESAVQGLASAELAALASLVEADKANMGDKSIAAALDRAFSAQFGLKLDVRSPIEKLQAALEPLTNRIADGVDSILTFLGKSSFGKWMMENPLKALGGIIVAMGALKAGGGALAKWGMGKIAGKLFGSSAGTAAAAAESAAIATTVATTAKPSWWSRIGGWFRGGGKNAAGAGATGAVSKETAGNVVQAVETGFSKSVIAEATALHSNNSLNLGLRPQTSKELQRAITTVIADNPALTKAQAIEQIARSGGGGAATAGVGGGVAKAGLKRALGPAIAALYFGYDVYQAKGLYDEGDTKGGNRTLASGAGALAGGWAGGKIGATIGTAFAPVIGTLIGTALGGIAGAAIGAFGLGSASDALSESLGVEGSEANRNKQKGFRPDDVVVRDWGRQNKYFLDGLRTALKNNETQRAMDMLAKNGIPGVNLEDLKRNQDFMTNDAEANKILSGARTAGVLAQYAYQSGQAISYEDFSIAAREDKYHTAAEALGITETQQDLVDAALRAKGHRAAPSLPIMQAYVEQGGKANQQRLMEMEAKVRNEHPEMSAGQVRAEATRRVNAEHKANLTQEDFENYADALVEHSRLQLEHADLVEEAATYGINEKGIIRNHRGQMVDAAGYLVDSNGARIDKEGRHEGEEGYEATRVGGALTGRALEAYNRLQNFRTSVGTEYADRMTTNEPSLERARKIVHGSNEEQEEEALRQLEQKGVDVKNRRFDQLFKSEQITEVENAVFSSEKDGLSEAARLARMSRRTGASLDYLRNLLYQSSRAGSTVGATQEGRKGSLYQRQEKAEKAKKQKEDREKEYSTLAKGATGEQIDEAFKEKGDREYYRSLDAKVKNGGQLTAEEQADYNQYQQQIGKHIKRRQAKKSAPKLHEEYAETKEEKEAIASVDRTSKRLKKEQRLAEGKPSLARVSDMRQMKRMAKAGMSRKELRQRFSPERLRQFDEAVKNGEIEVPDHAKPRVKKTAAQMRTEYEESVRSMAKGLREENRETFIANKMNEYDQKVAREQVRKEKAAKGETKEPGYGEGAPDATAVMQDKANKVPQISDAMAAAGGAAENAAASAKNAGGGDINTTNNVTVNVDGITMNVASESTPSDAEALKRSAADAGEKLGDMVARAVVGVLRSQGTA